MKNYLKIYLVSIAITLIISIAGADSTSLHDLGFMFGLVNLLSAGLLFVISVIMAIAGAKDTGTDLMAASGLMLLTGGIACTIFPLKWH